MLAGLWSIIKKNIISGSEEAENPYKIPDGPLLKQFMKELQKCLIHRDLLPAFKNSDLINYIVSRIVIYASK